MYSFSHAVVIAITVTTYTKFEINGTTGIACRKDREREREREREKYYITLST